MNRNIRIAREPVRIAKMLAATCEAGGIRSMSDREFLDQCVKKSDTWRYGLSKSQENIVLKHLDELKQYVLDHDGYELCTVGTVIDDGIDELIDKYDLDFDM